MSNLSLTEILGSLSEKTGNLLADDAEAEKDYHPSFVNQALSHRQDALFFAQAMNSYPFLDKKLQYDYYYHALPKAKRFHKWVYPEIPKDVEAVKEYYGCNLRRAKEIINVLTEQQIEIIKKRTDKGGFVHAKEA